MGPGLRRRRDRRPGGVRLRRQVARRRRLAFEDDRPDTLAEALAALERGLRKWFGEQGIDVGGRE
jgi:hypothetical protein